MAIKNQRAVGSGLSLAALGFAGYESGFFVGAFSWARGMLEATSDAQTVASFGSVVVATIAMIVGVAAALWGFGLFDRIRDWARWKPSRLTVLELIALSGKYGWDMNEGTQDRYKFGQALRQAGADGSVEISGRRTKRPYLDSSTTRLHPLMKLEPEYFRDHWIDIEQAVIHGKNVYVSTSLPARSEDSTEGDLHVDRKQGLRWLRTEANYWREIFRADLAAQIAKNK